MNEPIISPWVFYFLSLVNPLIVIFAVMAATLSIINFLFLLNDETHKRLLIANVIAIVVFILIPSQQTCYKMLIASYITPANIAHMRDLGETAALKLSNFIIDTSKKMQEGRQ